MRKQTIFEILLTMTVIGIIGCGKTENTPKATLTSTPVPTQVTEVSNLFTPVEERNTTVEVSKEMVLEGLCEELEKKDASKQAQYNVMNRVKSDYMEEDQNSLFCVDQDTGVVYFVNQNKDWYLYRLKDGEVELAVELPAKEIYIWDGTVYFMIDTYGMYELDGAKTGDIFAYTPADGTVKLVYAASQLGDWLHKLTVNEEGVFFSVRIFEKKLKDGEEYMTSVQANYRLPFGSANPVEDKRLITNAGNDEYYLTKKRENDSKNLRMILQSRTQESSYKELGIESPFLYCLMGDKLYYKSSLEPTQIGIKNITTGETEIYDYWETMKQSREVIGLPTEDEDKYRLDGVSSFTIAGDAIWVVAGNFDLFRIDQDSKEIVHYLLEKDKYKLEKLYTDGEQLYGLYSPSTNGDGHLVHILTDDTGWNEERKLETLGIKYLTE